MAEQVIAPPLNACAFADNAGMQFKADGSKAFVAKDFPLAIDLYSKALPQRTITG
jgi:hypothetical protein